MAFYITNKDSGLVLDATELQVRLQERAISSHKASQLWIIQKEKNYVVLKNVENGNVLDIDADRNVITTEQTEWKYTQQWSPQSDHIIRNEDSNHEVIRCKHYMNYVLDCEGGYLTPGTRLIVFPENSPESINQSFSYIEAI